MEKGKRLTIKLLILGIIIIFGILYSFNIKNNNSEFEVAKIDAINGNFNWITNLIYDNYSYSLNDFKEVISSNNYNNRQFYNVFNELSFKSTTPEVSCIEKKETPRCIFFNAILTNNEGLCKNFPEEKEEIVAGKYGSYKRIVYYQDSCILYTRIYSIYLNSNDKVEFCNSFEEDYIKEQCLFYLETPQRDFSILY